MKVITEAIVRAELKATQPEVYYIPEGKILSPAAREYLQGLQVAIDFEKNRAANEEKKQRIMEEKVQETFKNEVAAQQSSKYVDYETGASYTSKPEYMTQLHGNMLVDKNHPRIKYRGKLDRLEAEVVNAQCVIAANENSKELLADLDDILAALGRLMRCEVMDEELKSGNILGLTHDELRERSHNPMKYYNIKQLLLPNYSMGLSYSLLNLIRASVREAEVLAVDAFKENRKLTRTDIIEELNRLSSAMHIMMCKYLAGEYTKG